MPSWTEGYVIDVGYTTNIYREQVPSWLSFAGLLLGYPPLDLSRPFRMAELGCGHGLSLSLAAACSPQAEFWGFDLNPMHVESGRRFAEDAALTNVHFEERGFADLLSLDLPMFDVIVMHGVWSWITPKVRRDALDFIAAKLVAGGIVYNSYNVLTGWAAAVPLQTLMRLLGTGLRSDQVFPRVRQVIETMKQGGSVFLTINERAIDGRLKMLESHDPRYLAHEYMNEGWLPLMFADVAAEFAEARCGFIGSAALADNINGASVPSGMLQLVAETQDIVLRETLRDLGNGQSFRRDLFRRGIGNLTLPEHWDRVQGLVLEPLMPKPPGDITFACSLGQITGRPEVYGPIFDRFAQGPMTIGELRQMTPLADKPVSEALQAAALLVVGNFAYPRAPATDAARQAAQQATRRFNQTIARRNALGAAITQLAAPAIAAPIPADLIDTLTIGRLLDGAEADETALTDYAVDNLRRTSRNLQREGKPMEAEAMHEAVRASVRAVLQKRGMLEAVGVL